MNSPYDMRIKLLLIGDTGAGKTELLLHFANDSFSPTFITTIGVDFKTKNVDVDGTRIKLLIWDTAGQERFRTVTTSYFRGAQGVLLVYDVTNRTSFESIPIWLSQIKQHTEIDISMVLVGCRSEMTGGKVVSTREGRALAKEAGIGFYECSVKNDINVSEAFMSVVRAVKDRIGRDSIVGEAKGDGQGNRINNFFRGISGILGRDKEDSKSKEESARDKKIDTTDSLTASDQKQVDDTKKQNLISMQLWYNRALQGGKDKPRRLRLMISGPFGAGKTSIIRSLQGESFDPNYKSTEGIRIDKRQLGPKLTFQQAFEDWHDLQGIFDELLKEKNDDDLLEDTKERDLEPFLQSLSSADQEQRSTKTPKRANGSMGDTNVEEINIDDAISMSVWDFAGQIEYHSMHQIFFRSNCLYLLVLDLQTDDMDRISRTQDMLVDAQKWLNAIVSSAGTNIGLVVVGTHADCFTTREAANDRLKDLVKDLGKLVAPVEWDVLVGATKVVVDNRFGKGIPELRRTLQDLAGSLLDKVEDIPLRWLRLHEELESLSLEDHHFCVPLNSVEKITKKVGIIDKKELESALLYFDRSGDIVYALDERLRDWVFPQPRLLLNAMVPLLAPTTESEWLRTKQQEERRQLQEEGYLSNDALKRLWNEAGFEDQDQLREVLSASGLIMDFGHGAVVPCRLPDEEVKQSQKDGEQEIVVENYFTTHLPPSLFSYVLATIHHEHGMRDLQDLSMISQSCSCLALDVPTTEDRDSTKFDFRVVISISKKSHSILMKIQASPKSGEPDPSMKECLVRMCLLLLGTLHSSVNRRYQELKLTSWCRIASGGDMEIPEWPIVETEGTDGGEQSFKVEHVCRFGRRYALSDTVSAVGGNKDDPKQRPVDPVLTRMLLSNGSEEDVGQLSHDDVPHPESVWPCELKKPYVFLSHRGPDTKEIIGRPTYWFLTHILKVETFLDNETMNPSDPSWRSLMEPAYRCNHALVLLSPLFRESKYCVKELNTFMIRFKNKQNITVIPALWQVESVEGYAPALRDINYLKLRAPNPAACMIDELWPFLVRTFGDGKSYEREVLVRFLIEYVEQIPETKETPKSLDEFVKQNKQ